jgi:uncharacterized protein YjbI with pentapeptide repeats
VWWAGSVVVLIGLVVLASWLAYRSKSFSAVRQRWNALQQSPAPSWLLPLGLAVIALLAIFIVWKLPQWQVAQVRSLEPKERFDRVNEARKTLATILGGIVLLAGFFGTWRNLQLTQESLRVSQEGQITDRFTKAIEQLGAVDKDGKPKLDVRLGGIYALERIANDSERDHWPIMEVLCTYVREHAPVTLQDQGKQPPTNHPVSADVQAILTVLGRRDRKYEKGNQTLNLHQTDLYRADLHDADLGGANLSDANLSEADLGGAHLSGARLIEADLSRADLSRADLSGADLIVADLSGADLIEADLSGADLSGAYLSRADLIRADLGVADLSGAYLSGADLSRAYLPHARNLTQGQIEEAYGDRTTKLPADLHMPESWKK